MASLLPNTLPLAMLMELTHRCPLRCAYCSNPLALSPASAELPTAAWKAALDEAVVGAGGDVGRRGRVWIGAGRGEGEGEEGEEDEQSSVHDGEGRPGEECAEDDRDHGLSRTG